MAKKSPKKKSKKKKAKRKTNVNFVERCPIPTLEKGTSDCAKCSWSGPPYDVFKNMVCLGCYETFKLCTSCFPGTTACSGSCQKKYRENVNNDMKRGIQVDSSKDFGPLFNKKS